MRFRRETNCYFYFWDVFFCKKRLLNTFEEYHILSNTHGWNLNNMAIQFMSYVSIFFYTKLELKNLSDITFSPFFLKKRETFCIALTLN